MPYERFEIALSDGSATTAQAFLAAMKNMIAPALVEAGGAVLGLFAPQIGPAGHTRYALVHWPEAPGRVVLPGSGVGSLVRDPMEATARPSSPHTPAPGGVYVHRWFIIAEADQARFVELSVAAWADFEARFDAQIYGLFRAYSRPEDGANARMLLLTRYASHGEWERSRDPTSDAMELFRQRQALTRATMAVSTLLIPGA